MSDTFKAIIKVHELNDVLVDNDVDEESGAEVENPTEIIPYENRQPLTEELKYFVENLDKKIEIADGQSGYEVVKVLEKAQQLIDEK